MTESLNQDQSVPRYQYNTVTLITIQQKKHEFWKIQLQLFTLAVQLLTADYRDNLLRYRYNLK